MKIYGSFLIKIHLNFVVQALQFFRQPLLLLLVVIVSNLVLIEEITENSFSFMLLETKCRTK